MSAKQTTVGVLGGGQLGRMLAEAANRLGIKMIFVDKTGTPGKQITAHGEHIDGDFKDEQSIQKLADKQKKLIEKHEGIDVLTIEIEHVNVAALQTVSSQFTFEPALSTIKLIQNKYHQKQHLEKHSISIAPFLEVRDASKKGLEAVGEQYGFPFMLKSQTEAYDGKGNYAVRKADDIPAALETLRGKPLYAEKWSNFTMELAVLVVKTKDGVLSYPTVETVHEDSICKLVFCPPRNVPGSVSSNAQQLAKDAVATFSGKGVFAVEMFLLHNGTDFTLQVNEIAPRVHNSGHLTMEACAMSQFEAHLRAILDLPIPPESLELESPAIMLNILGGASPTSHLEVRDAAYSIKRARTHLYGKGIANPGRKMGHVTVTGRDPVEAYGTIFPLKQLVDKIRASRTDIPPSSAAELFAPKRRPQVLVCIGSVTDKPAVEPALDILRKCGIRYKAHVLSAHRMPDDMAAAGKSAAKDGFKVIIAAAGGSAHLPGMIAAYTPLPVIAITVKGSSFDGMDSVMSSLQMPNGTPVAVMGVGRGANAGLFAAEILGTHDDRVQERRLQLKKEDTAKSRDSSRQLEEEEDKKQDEA